MLHGLGRILRPFRPWHESMMGETFPVSPILFDKGEKTR